jgi:hypothetical protein
MTCIRCGLPVVDNTCEGCTWPYEPEAWTRWDRRRRPSFRITLDTGCVNARQRDPDLNRLEAWSKAGQISLQRSRVLLEELQGQRRIVKAQSLSPQPSLWTLGRSSLGSDEHAVLAARMPDETALARIVFPTTTDLTEGHRYDVRHLQWHVHTGGDLFVTHDGDFLRHHRELYRIGIWVFRPAEAVAHVERWLRT